MRNIILAFLIITIYSCETASKEDEYDYISLSSFKDDSLIIKNGTPIKLLAFSGGKNNDKEHVYYYQVIVINQETGDTLTVITPALKVPNTDGTGGKIYIPPMEFNPDKKVFEATYERKSDTSLNFLLQVMGDESKLTEGSDVSKYNKMVKPELVAINNSLPIFKNNYKTVVGILVFDKDPH
ncbi:MAG: hypothetical protein ABIN36_08280 [Ferruginibacter sp.]